MMRDSSDPANCGNQCTACSKIIVHLEGVPTFEISVSKTFWIIRSKLRL